VERWFSTHPLTQDRIDNTQSYINRLSTAQRNGRANDSGYTNMKSRLQRYQRAPS
jgi:predicted Zn-dependent protease